MSDNTPGTVSARRRAAQALAAACRQFPDLDPLASDLGQSQDDPNVQRLALAIQRTALQRWITLEYLLDLFLKQDMRHLEYKMRGLLLSAAAQIVFFDRVPVYAVVNESVALAQSMVRRAAGGMSNAVLRRLAELVAPPVHGQPWKLSENALPLEDGFVPLLEECLPAPADLPNHLSVATSHPQPLVSRWLEQFGAERTIELCRHSCYIAPIIVAVEPALHPAALAGLEVQPHQLPGFILWQDSREKLRQFLAGHPSRRVQDPASAKPVGATADLDVGVIVDYCAGRGTKSRQLLAQHPQAKLFACDVAAARLADLQTALAGESRARVARPGDLELDDDSADLLVLDVPCSNTAVLARRPEARYRYRQGSLLSVANLQRKIIDQSLPLLRPGGWILYCTCSLEELENQQQARYLAKQAGGTIVREETMFPEGSGPSYHDGSYHALIRRD